MRPKQVLQLKIRVNLGVMAMKRYYTLNRAPELEPHNQDTGYLVEVVLSEAVKYIPSPTDMAKHFLMKEKIFHLKENAFSN